MKAVGPVLALFTAIFAFGAPAAAADTSVQADLDGDGTPLRLREGGNQTTISGYGCDFVDGRYQLFTVTGELVDEEIGLYLGERVCYDVRDGAATETSRHQLADNRDAFRTSHLMCT